MTVHDLIQQGYTEEEAYIIAMNKMANGGPYNPLGLNSPNEYLQTQQGFRYSTQEMQPILPQNNLLTKDVPQEQTTLYNFITPLTQMNNSVEGINYASESRRPSLAYTKNTYNPNNPQENLDNYSPGTQTGLTDLTQDRLGQSSITEEKQGSTYNYQVPQAPNTQTMNPYGGVDLSTAASYLGSSIESGNALGAVASGLKLLTGAGRKAFSAAGRVRRNEYLQNEYQEDVRDYLTQENNKRYVGGENGGQYTKLPKAPSLTPYENGGSKSKIDQTKLLTGEFITGASPNNTAVDPNSELEKNEYIITPEGGSMKVLGDTHEKGGENIELNEGDMVISDNLKLKGDTAKLLREKYDIKVKAKDTYAEAVDKIYKEIGLTKLIKEEEKILERIKKEQEGTKDGTTQSLNLQYLYKQRDKIVDKKDKLDEERLSALKTVFTLQEKSKPKEDQSQEKFQDGGQKLSPYAYVMFEGTPEQKSYVQYDMSKYFTPNGEYWEANNRQETAEEHLERMRPIYENMKESGTLQEYIENNKGFILDEIEEESNKELFQDGGIASFNSVDYTQSKNDSGTYGNANKKALSKLINNNSWWYDFSEFDPDDPKDVKKYQKAFNSHVEEGAPVLDVDGKLGVETITSLYKRTPTGKGIDKGEVTNAPSTLLPRPSPASKEKDTEEENTPTEEEENSKSSNAGAEFAFLPQQSILPPSAMEGQLSLNRRYDRVDPNLLSPEQIIQENQRQAQTAYAAAQGLPDAQRAAALAQISVNTQNANAQAIYQTEASNAQLLNQAQSQNAQIQMAEENVNANDALSFEKRQQTAQAITEEQTKQYYDYLRRLQTSKFNDIRKMNTVNSIFDNYDINADGTIDVNSDMTQEQLWEMYKRGLITPSAPTKKQ